MNLFADIYQEEKASLAEILGFVLALGVLLIVVIPLAIEYLNVWRQGQDTETIAAQAAQAACSLTPSNLRDTKQGSLAGEQGALGGLLDYASTQNIMEQAITHTISQSAKNPTSYTSCNLTLYDINDHDLTKANIRENLGYPRGYIGANPARTLCPASDPSQNKPINWCLDPNSDITIKQNFRIDNLAQTQDEQEQGTALSLRMEYLQGGRNLPSTTGDNYTKSLNGILYKCSVIVNKRVEYIFNIPILNQFIGITDNAGLPNIISKKSEAMFRYTPISLQETNSYKTILPLYENYEMANSSLNNRINDEDIFQISTQYTTDNGNIADRVDSNSDLTDDFWD